MKMHYKGFWWHKRRIRLQSEAKIAANKSIGCDGGLAAPFVKGLFDTPVVHFRKVVHLCIVGTIIGTARQRELR